MQTRGLGELAELLMTLPREFWPFLRRTLPRFPARQPFERFKLFVIADELLCSGGRRATLRSSARGRCSAERVLC